MKNLCFDVEDLIAFIRTNIGTYEVIKVKSDQYGYRYKVFIDITGPNGNTATVLTAWIVAEDKMGLTSAYAKDRSKK